MSDLPEDFGGEAPLFPLPNLVFFPNTILPLHVFEPRYRQMTEDALAGDRLIAMATLKPGWERDYEKSPPIHGMVCLGRIIDHKKLDDGRYYLTLEGVSRARVLHEKEKDGYRIGALELVDEPAMEGDMEKAHALAREVSRLIEEVAPPAPAQNVYDLSPPDLDEERLRAFSFQVAGAFKFQTGVKLRFLATDKVLDRLAFARELLERRADLLKLGPDVGEEFYGFSLN